MEAVELLKQLIAIPSVSPSIKPGLHPDGEARVCDFLAEIFGANGLSAETVEVLPGRPNLYVRLDFGKEKTVILSAHTDTVPADDWTDDPYQPVEKDDSIHGRGSCDTKASIAVFADAALDIFRRKSCRYNLIFAAICDEEAGFSGAAAAATHLTADLAIAGEPTQLRALHQHKGVIRLVLKSTGKSCHSSAPERGENAIYPMAKAVIKAEELAEKWKNSTSSSLGPRLLNVTLINGGQAANVIPDSATADVDIRTIPGDDIAAIISELSDAVRPYAVVESPYLAGPALYTDPGNELAKAFSSATGFDLANAPYATDAAVYSAGGIPALVFGPGDAKFAHTTYEQIEISQLHKAKDVLMRFLSD